MNVLWLAWKDYNHPERGGAEVILRELLHRQIADGHHATLLTARYPGSTARETVDDIDIIRVGNNRYIHSLQALAYYLRHLRGKFDAIIETVNTAPYCSLLFRGRTPAYALYHQLARDIWYHETKSPLSHVGYYFLEPFSTWLLSRSRSQLITISESTKRDLAQFGWNPRRAHIISEGIEIPPVPKPDAIEKYRTPTMLSLGAMRSMKRTIDQIKAFETAKQLVPTLQLKIAGDATGEYGDATLNYIAQSPHKRDISYLGRVPQAQKIELMQRSHVITVTSVKEGWGLIVTEAASQGTPAVVYDVDGLHDSVKHNETGLVTQANPFSLALGVSELLTNQSLYQRLQRAAWQWSTAINFDTMYRDFKTVLEARTI